MLTTIAIENYRSLRDLRLPLEQLNVVTGANGTGKSNVYRALRLLGRLRFGPSHRITCPRGRARICPVGRARAHRCVRPCRTASRSGHRKVTVGEPPAWFRLRRAFLSHRPRPADPRRVVSIQSRSRDQTRGGLERSGDASGERAGQAQACPGRTPRILLARRSVGELREQTATVRERTDRGPGPG